MPILFRQAMLWFGFYLTLSVVRAEEVLVAVAANFMQPMQKIAQEFEQTTGHKVVTTFGSTGQFYAQIKHGAPFDVFLAADESTPLKLEQEGAVVLGSRFTYARGKLLLWTASTMQLDDAVQVLKKRDFAHLAIANPKLAPYGAAALQTIQTLQLEDRLQPKIVQAENITQAYQFVATGNAELGFIALSQVFREGKIAEGTGWIVPDSLYKPIVQDAALLEKGRGNQAALGLLAYLKSASAQRVIQSFGYGLEK